MHSPMLLGAKICIVWNKRSACWRRILEKSRSVLWDARNEEFQTDLRRGKLPHLLPIRRQKRRPTVERREKQVNHQKITLKHFHCIAKQRGVSDVECAPIWTKGISYVWVWMKSVTCHTKGINEKYCLYAVQGSSVKLWNSKVGPFNEATKRYLTFFPLFWVHFTSVLLVELWSKGQLVSTLFAICNASRRTQVFHLLDTQVDAS